MTLLEKHTRRVERSLYASVLRDLCNKTKPELIACFLAHNSACITEKKMVARFMACVIAGCCHALLKEKFDYDTGGAK